MDEYYEGRLALAAPRSALRGKEVGSIDELIIRLLQVGLCRLHAKHATCCLQVDDSTRLLLLAHWHHGGWQFCKPFPLRASPAQPFAGKVCCTITRTCIQCKYEAVLAWLSLVLSQAIARPPSLPVGTPLQPLQYWQQLL